jgi:hypothetical protein
MSVRSQIKPPDLSSTPILALAIRGVNTMISFDSVTNLSAELGNEVKESTRHFTSRDPLFEASYIFYV